MKCEMIIYIFIIFAVVSNAAYTDACGGYIDLSYGTIQSPSFPDFYPPNTNCVWHIVAPDQYRITLSFTHFDLEGNNHDTVRVSSGEGAETTVHGIFCGSLLPDPITSDDNTLRIEFNTNGSIERTGFKALFSRDACGGYIDLSYGTIQSPSFPDFYPPNTNCVWHIVAPDQYRITLSFTHFDLEGNNYDTVRVSSGEGAETTVHGIFCGSLLPVPITSDDNTLRIEFNTDGSIERTGFKALFSRGFELNTAAELLFPNDYSMTYTSFHWTESPTLLTASAVIIDDVNVTVPVLSDSTNKVGSFNVTSGLLSSNDFGVYHVQLILVYAIGKHTEDMVLYYEEPIVITQVNTPSIMLIESPMELTAILSSGSNIEFEWIMSENDSASIECVDIVRECKTYYNYTTTGHFNITLVATNEASYQVINNIFVDVFNPVIEFELILASPLIINGNGSAEFTLTLDSNERLPMGNINISIDYGDGTYELLPLNETFKAQLTLSISHVYLKQGEFTTVAYVSSSLSTQHLTNFTVKVWDDISSLSLSIPAFANVSEAVHFEFKNYLAYGFEFQIEYDDGDTLETTPDVLNNVFDTTPWTYAYSSPKVYEVKLEAWNPEFSVTSKYNITIQYPITDLSITPAPTPVIKYPIPDGNIEFIITQIDNHPAPTDVTCYFSFENGEVSKTENVDISYGQPLRTSFTHTTSGVKDINITCINGVSMYTVLTTINVLDVQLEDYTFTYPVMPSVNTSLDANNELESFSLDIQFDISLLNCSKFPVGDSLSFKFEEGTVSDVSGFQFVHSFSKRGISKILVTISNSNTSISKELQIKIGKVDFTINTYVASVGMSIVTFNISGPATGGTYDIFTDNVVSFTNLPSSSNPIYQDYKYRAYGTFYPYVVANFPTFTERVHIEEPIYADYNLSAIEINFNTTIELPPGEITVTVSKHELSADLPNVKCVFDFGDQIDRSPREVTQDITEDSTLTYNFTYITLGYQHANITCYNNYDRNENVTIITVQNECFPMTGIFDRQYSNSSNPLKLITSQDVDLSSRMPVKCADKDVVYDWRMYRVFNNTNEPFNHTPPEQPLGSMRFPRGSVPQGLYRITLNVSLPETYVSEPTYVQFIKPPPFALIDGGSQRQATATTPIVTMDALTHSYDLELGYGGNQNLTYEWSCQRVAARNLGVLSHRYHNEAELFKDCNELLNTTVDRGKAELNILKVSYEGYAITVNVSIDDLLTEFTQLILRVPGTPPIVFLMCENINCSPKKYAITSKSIWKVFCFDCTDDDILSYKWHLWYEVSDQFWVEMYDMTVISDTGTTSESFVINSNVLQANTRYSVTVIVTGYGREGYGESAMEFRTNLAPYDGRCEADPPIGNASTTGFNIKCYDWKDEGAEDERDVIEDRKAQNPLKYEFLTVEYISEENGVESERLTSFQFGGETTATEINLPVGDPDNNYTIYLRVFISDLYGDYNVSDLTVISIPPEEYIPKDSNDVGASVKLFDHYGETFAEVDKGGNIMALMRLMDSTASIYKDSALPAPTVPDVSTPIKCANYRDGEDEQSKVKRYLREKTKHMVDAMNTRTPPSDSKMGLSSSNAGFVAKALGQSITNKALFTETTSTEVSKNTRKVIQNVKKRIKIRPLPMAELSGTRRAVKEVVNILADTLGYWKTVATEDLGTEMTEDVVKEFFDDYYWKYPDKYDDDIKSDNDYDDLVQKCLKSKKKIREKQRIMADATKVGAEDMFESVNDALDTTAATTSPGEGEQLINKTDLTLSVEKDSKEAFLNKSVITRKGMSLQFDNESLSNVTDTNMELQVTVFEKSPIIHASDASKITGRVMNIAVKDQEGNKIEIPLNMRIGNEGVSYFKEHMPIYYPDDPEQMMYLKLKLNSDSDSIIVYLKLDDDVMESINKRDLYKMYAKAGTRPTSSDYDFTTIIQATDFEEIGYKVFVPGGIMTKGDIIVALKAIEEDIKKNTKSRRKRSASVNGTLTTATNTTDLKTTNISLAIVTTGCRVYDPSTSTWSSNGCSVLPFSTLNETVCRCEPEVGSIFSLSFAAPNMIDFSTVWGKFDPANGAVYATLIALLVIYFISVVILRRKDKKDTVRSMPTFLCDNKETDGYFYMVAVHTGLRPGAGTKSNVCFILAGEANDSGVRLLSDGERKGFETNSVNFYIMSTSSCCGDLNYVRVWHDNSGDGNTNSWYLHKIVVTDIQTDEIFIFHCDKWLAIDMDDGMIDRVIPVVSRKECGFDTAFSQQSRANITENHLWLSLVIRPQKNVFTRVQRLSCLLMLLFLTMITNAMFFKSSDDDAVTPDTVQIGGMRLSLKVIYVSFIGCLITVPPIFAATYLFKNASERIVKKKRNTECESIMMIRQKKTFPYWVVYIAWVVVALAVVTSAFFLLLYSMQWGKAKAEEWLTTFILSFMESVFLVDPFKVIIIAVLIAFIMRKPVEDEKLSVDLASVRKQAKHYRPSENSEFLAFRLEVMGKGGPPPAEMMKQERNRVLIQKEAKHAFTRLLLHIFFAAVLYCMSYINRDQRGFLYKAHIDSHLYTSSKYQYGFSKITAPEHLFDWLKKTMIPLYYPTAQYNGDSISVRDTFFVGDMSNLRLGLVRLRQVKVKKAKCYGHELVRNHFCGRLYKENIEETADLCGTCSTPLTTDAWKYVSAKDVWGIPILGIYNSYGGGGYIQSFSNIKANTENIVDELHDNRWIDRLTRAVFVEFALYNANINVICYSIFLVEFPETGGAMTWVDTQCFRPTMITSATGAFNLLLNIFFVAIVIGRMVSMFKALVKQKLQFFKNFWNVLDILIVIISYIGVGIWIAKFVFTKKALDMYYNNKNTFINFQHIVVWEYAFNCFLGVLVFISTIRISSALGYNKRITEIAYVLRSGSNEILGFGLQFVIIFFAFVMFGYLTFGITLYEYRNLFISFGSLLNSIIGKNTLGKMQQAAPIFAEAFFFVYVFFVVFTLLTMFAAILNNTIIHVRSENKNNPGPVGITDVLIGTFKDMAGLVGIHMKNKPTGKHKLGFKHNRYSTGPVSTAKVIDLVRETLSDAIDEENMVRNKGRKSDKAFLNALLTQKSPIDASPNKEYPQTCTPRFVEIEFNTNEPPLRGTPDSNINSSHLYTL